MTGPETHLDLVLEELVAEVLRLTEGPVLDERIVVHTASGWRLAVWLDEDTFSVDLLPEGGELDALDDYQLALIYGLGFEDAGDEEYEPAFFRQEYDYEQGEEWEEQVIRELALLMLGLLRDVLDCRPVEAYRVEGERD